MTRLKSLNFSFMLFLLQTLISLCLVGNAPCKFICFFKVPISESSLYPGVKIATDRFKSSNLMLVPPSAVGLPLVLTLIVIAVSRHHGMGEIRTRVVRNVINLGILNINFQSILAKMYSKFIFKKSHI